MATCSVSYTPTVAGHHMITGTYSGDSTHASSTGSFTLNVRSPPGRSASLRFASFDLDDFSNGIGQLQIFINGQLAIDIPAGVNHLSGSGDYPGYDNQFVSFGPFNVTIFLVDGQNTITLVDPLHYYFDSIYNLTIAEGDSVLLHIFWTGVSPGHSSTFTFSGSPIVVTSFTSSPASQTVNQPATLTVTYTGGTGPFICIFIFGDGEHATVAGNAGTCSVTHDYDQSGSFIAKVIVAAVNTSASTSTVTTFTVSP